MLLLWSSPLLLRLYWEVVSGLQLELGTSKSCFRVKLKLSWFWDSLRALKHWFIRALEFGVWELETFVAWEFGIQKVILKVLLKIWEWLLRWRGIGGVRVGCLFGYSITSLPYSCLLTFILMLKSWGWVGVWWVHLDYSVSSGPFLTMNYEFDQDHGPRPGPELDNIFHVKQWIKMWIMFPSNMLIGVIF